MQLSLILCYAFLGKNVLLSFGANYDNVPQTLLTSFDIFEKYVGGVNAREIFLWICLL